jgi:hypothetical protein
MNKMKQYGVWEAVENDGQRTLDGKWVFTRKTDGTSGFPSAYKARYVVKGFRQIEGKDYSELFASVAHKDSVRVFLSIVNHLDLECHQVDIKGAFPNGVIDKLIYLTPPDASGGYHWIHPVGRYMSDVFTVRETITNKGNVAHDGPTAPPYLIKLKPTMAL